MMKKVDRRKFLKVMGAVGAVCTMTALTGCSGGGGSAPSSDGSVPLSYLEPFNGSVVWNNLTPTDPFGCTYANGVNYMVFRRYECYWTNTRHNAAFTIFYGEVEYLLDKKYKKLTMNLNAYKEAGEYGWGKINVYADGNLVKTSPEIVKKTKDTVKFEVDVSNVNYLKIVPEVSTGGSNYYGEMILWDVKLWK